MKDNFSGGGAMWDQRFGDYKHLYSMAPNKYFKSFIDSKKPGSILLPADGEGRNGVYAAKQGWSVTTFDYSKTGIQHANEFANQEGVNITALYDTIETVDFKAECFDVIAIVFLHLPPAIRATHFPRITKFLKPGGTLYVLGFTKEQINNTSGGPKNVDMLFSHEELSEDFKALKCLKNQPFIDVLDEGPKHQGNANLIEYIGRK